MVYTTVHERSMNRPTADRDIPRVRATECESVPIGMLENGVCARAARVARVGSVMVGDRK